MARNGTKNGTHTRSASSWPFNSVISKDKYDTIMEQKREHLVEVARDRLASVVNRHHGDTLIDTSLATGLCPATISKYRSGKWGKRGPLYTTYLAFSGRH